MLELSVESNTQKFSIISLYLLSPLICTLSRLDCHQLATSQMPGIFYILKIEKAEGQNVTFK